MRTLALRISLIVTGLLAAGPGASSAIAQRSRTDSAAPITLPNTHVHMLHSRVNGRTYLIQVSLPNAYVNAKPGDVARYPTLYDLDIVLADFPLLYDQQQWAPNVRPIILVGVTAVVPTETKWFDREFDYTPPLTPADSQYFKRTGMTPPQLGGAQQFLRVLKEEIIPLIDSS